MNLNAYRTRAERGEVQLGTWEGVRQMIALGAPIINYASDAAVLRASFAAVVADVAKGA